MPRLQQYDLSVRQKYSNISDEDLDRLVQHLIGNFPHTGYRIMSGLLRSNGCNVQQYRVRQAMRHADPCGVLFRGLFATHFRIHRTYSVSGPFALWHIDGYKLIR